MNTKDVLQSVANRFIESLEREGLSWIKPWSNQGFNGIQGMPQNPCTKTWYKGINRLILMDEQFKSDYKSDCWLTLKNITNLGGLPKEGEQPTMIIHSSINFLVKYKEDKVEKTKFFSKYELAKEFAKEQKSKVSKFWRQRPHYVYNEEQCQNIPRLKPIKPKLKWTPLDFEPIKSAEAALAAWEAKPSIKDGMFSAYYSPHKDYIGMPSAKSFRSEASYYATLFHELVHSTGHQSRLGRFKEPYKVEFGSESYSREELIAEVGSATILAMLGIDCPDCQDNTNSYLKHWAKDLKEQPAKAVVSAIAQADQAVRMILTLES